MAGKVTKVSGDKVTVKGQVLQAPTKKNARPKATTKTVAVTLSGTTRVDQTVTATDAVLTVGTCVTAAGTTDSVGTVTANTVTVSAPENGSCTGGFRFGRGGGPGGPGATDRRPHPRPDLTAGESVAGAGAVAAQRHRDRDREQQQAVEERGLDRVVEGPDVLGDR